MKIQNLIAGALLLTMLAGCGAEKTTAGAQTELPAAESENTLWVPKGTELRMAETKHCAELAEVIAETYGIPKEEWDDTRYSYNYVDLNDDGTDEIFAVVMGMYTSGSGGDSALIVQPAAGMIVSQQFTLVRAPILVSDHRTNGVSDLIFLRSGGGSEPAFVRLTCTDGIYGNPSDAEVLSDLNGVSGTAILCGDASEDLNSGNMLTLNGRRSAY